MKETVLRATIPSSQAIGRYRYAFIYESFFISRVAYLMVEGIGIHGSYHITGSYRIHDYSPLILHVKASGYTAATDFAAHERVIFSIDATVYKGETKLITKALIHPSWRFLPKRYDDAQHIVDGEAVLTLPDPLDDPTPLRLIITGSYQFANPGGTGVSLPLPVGGIAREEFIIPVEENTPCEFP